MSLPKGSVRRGIYALAVVLLTELVGTVGFHALEVKGWIDSFYFESMLATGQGPPLPLTTDSGKVFASIMGFVSVGSVVGAAVFGLGPLIAQLWSYWVKAAEGEVRKLEHDLAGRVRRLEEEWAERKEADHGSRMEGRN